MAIVRKIGSALLRALPPVLAITWLVMLRQQQGGLNPQTALASNVGVDIASVGELLALISLIGDLASIASLIATVHNWGTCAHRFIRRAQPDKSSMSK